MTKQELKYLLKKNRLTPDHAKGQNFLIDESVFKKIISTARVNDSNTVIEIGPGIGSLTAKLAEQAGRVIAVEVDHSFMPLLSNIENIYPNVKVVYADILKTSFEELTGDAHTPYRIIANIPYYLTSKLLSTVLTSEYRPQDMLILVQKEVAERICARAGDHSRLSLGVQLYGTPKIVSDVSKTSFYPAPEVDSSLLKIDSIHSWDFSVSEKRTWQIIRIGFSSKRKKLLNNLTAGLALERDAVLSVLTACDISSDLRAEDLEIEQWLSLAEALPE